MYRPPSSRVGRHSAQLYDFKAVHELYYRELCDLMEQRGCSPVEALKHLHAKVTTEQLPNIPPTERQNFKLCWNRFIRTCASKNPKLLQYKLT